MKNITNIDLTELLNLFDSINKQINEYSHVKHLISKSFMRNLEEYRELLLKEYNSRTNP